MTYSVALKKSLLKIYPFTEEQLDQFTERVRYSTLYKKQLLLKPGQFADSIVFVCKGSLRHYVLSEEIELTINFYTENSWVADIESLLKRQPSANYIEALEETEIASLGLQDIHFLMDVHPAFRMLNVLMSNFTISTTHLTAIKSKSPDERYRALLEVSPDWINRFPQHQIASYLGMTPETLSRVRARIN